MSKLTLKDLKKQGFELSKQDAQELHSLINHIAQRGDDINEVYPESDDVEPDEEQQPESPDALDPAALEDRIEYLEAEDFEYNAEKKAWIDENNAVVTEEMVNTVYEDEKEFYELVKNIIIDSVPYDKQFETGTIAIDEHDTGNDQQGDNTGAGNDKSEEGNGDAEAEETGGTAVDTRSRAQKAADTRKVNAARKAELIERAVTKEDLDADPTLAAAGIKAGDLHKFPKA
jgi:hypothetical protein